MIQKKLNGSTCSIELLVRDKTQREVRIAGQVNVIHIIIHKGARVIKIAAGVIYGEGAQEVWRNMKVDLRATIGTSITGIGLIVIGRGILGVADEGNGTGTIEEGVTVKGQGRTGDGVKHTHHNKDMNISRGESKRVLNAI